MNFAIVTQNIFKIDLDYHKRILLVIKKTNGLLKFTNILTSDIFMDNVKPENVTIDNEPMINLKQLQEIIFNKNCFCVDNGGGDEFKIFDRTFDRTFE